MGIKDFFVKKAVQLQLKKLPKEQREMVETLLENNPELFSNMAKDMKELTKQGKNEMAAMMEVMKKYQADLQKALGGKIQKRRPF